MRERGASEEAIAFQEAVGGGYLAECYEKGSVDLGLMVFPDDKGKDEEKEYILFNESAPLIYTVLWFEESKGLEEDMKTDDLYVEIMTKYPGIAIWGFNSQFVTDEALPNGGKRFIFQYRILNNVRRDDGMGFRVEETEYSGLVGFDFHSQDWRLHSKTFLGIRKGGAVEMR